MQKNDAFLYDTHVHSTFSHDGKSTFDEYATAMAEKRVKGIGFTEHLDFAPEAAGYGRFKYEMYKKALNEYRDMGYEFYGGIELGYFAYAEEETLAGIRDKQFDYIIGAVHRVDGQSMSTKRFRDFIESSGDYISKIEHYYQSVSRSIRFRPFDVIAHIGVYKGFLTEENRNSNRLVTLVEEMENEVASECAASGKIVEVNTSRLHSALGETIPGRSFLESYYKKGGRLISIASDAHSAMNLARGFETAAALLENIGYKYITLPWDREHPVRIGE